MATDVETILIEIRETVRAEEAAKRAAAGEIVSPATIQLNGSAETLSSLSPHLTTTARAWDRLPPVLSNRTGSSARLELWLKSKLKKLTRWFTWEQVNFNSAVHHALTETERAFSGTERRLAALTDQLANLRATLAGETEKFRAQLSQKDREIHALRAAIDERAHTTAQAFDRHLSELARELRERDEQISAEQRVCFKQLSLEAIEAAAREERDRKAIELRMKELESK